jgi:hypothetical protein
MHILPKTLLGKWSLLLISVIVFLLVAVQIIANIQGPRDRQTFFDDLWVTVPVVVAMASGIAAFVTGLISIIRKERALLVYITTFIGFLMLLFLAGELFWPAH